MFTGLVEEIGTVAAVTRASGGYQLRIEASRVLEDAALGDSIAVNGVCLTVASFDETSFTVGLAPETRARTNLEDLGEGDKVALERAALPTTRLGGHYVQGHVDATGVIKYFRPDEDALWMSVETPPELMRYIAPKGYIAIDGASLTVVHTGPDWFDVTLIAYSREKLVLPHKAPGARVNLEVDILAKYVERLLGAGDGEKNPLHPEAPRPRSFVTAASQPPQDGADFSAKRPLSKEILSAHGYMKEGAR